MEIRSLSLLQSNRENRKIKRFVMGGETVGQLHENTVNVSGECI